MKYIFSIYVIDIQYSAKIGLNSKFKMAAMAIYGENHLNDFLPRTTRRIRLIFYRKHMGHLAI